MTAVHIAPLTESRTLIVAIPESTVEDFGKFILQRGSKFRSVAPLTDSVGCPAVALCRLLDIFSAPGPALDLEDLYASIDDLVHELNGTQILRRHDVLIVDVKFRAGLKIGDLIATAAKLVAGATVGRSTIGLETQIALPGDGHAERSVGEHLNPDKFP